ncbi:MAG: c-type cytochrome [Calditrichaceae bacterium]|nr:c-type cytochrome [Calditrichaceae bacterium]MBN2708909.1 c-type cytochrome [Calditrichaceae bacterium]RQV97567.1 MAG: cytochrome C [Calditrichota bacterium]
MNYPVWELTSIGGGSLIALIAVLHVYIAHLAVGGGLFIWLTDRKAFKDNNPALHDYIKKHTWFFLLLTMVFGGMTGVGIWFIIALVNPAGTSMLIHNFVWGWAIEWVFFGGEIAALLVYHYQFERLTEPERNRVSFLYFLFAWLSLFVINGILAFMLTPGKWLETQNFWHGFFNPTFFSSLAFRSFMCMIIAGLFAFVTTVRIKDSIFRKTMMRYTAKWLIYTMPGLILSAIWYFYSIPQDIRNTAFNINPQSALFINIFILTTILIFIGGIVFSLRIEERWQKIITAVMILVGLLWMGGFEYSREIARKPFIISHYMYTTGIKPADAENLNHAGILKTAKWSAIREITEENKLQAGKELFNLQCLSCHTVNGIRNDIIPRTKDLTYLGLIAQLTGQGRVLKYMPPFIGTEKEKKALAHYILEELQQKPVSDKESEINLPILEDTISEFNPAKSDYVLLCWSDLGMHCISDAEKWFTILPPANTMEAQLIKRGPVPELVSENIELTYEIEDGFKNPAQHVDFWKYSEMTFGRKIPYNKGLTGNGLNGVFEFDENRNSFKAEAIPVVPYSDAGIFNPYPLFTIKALNKGTGELLAKANVVAPASTKMGCLNCHEGNWRFKNRAGMADETAINILKIHDRINNTELYKSAADGKPQLCQDCHEDPALNTEGKPDVLNFSAAMHGWHANYLPYDDARSCILCHPANPIGITRCNRGLHNSLRLVCTDCHGTMQEHSLSLLKGQVEKPASAALMANLTTTNVNSTDDVEPRTPWIKEPDCLTCHQDFEKPAENSNAFNIWNDEFEELYRIRTDNAEIRCPACHGSTHALYPAKNPYGKQRDNLQPIQYSGQPFPIGSNNTCEVCHKTKMQDAIHHENMEHAFRNPQTAP